jgi:hypothetical protein
LDLSLLRVGAKVILGENVDESRVKCFSNIFKKGVFTVGHCTLKESSILGILEVDTV